MPAFVFPAEAGTHLPTPAVHRAIGSMVWNSLSDYLRAQQDYESFRQRLKTWLFSSY